MIIKEKKLITVQTTKNTIVKATCDYCDKELKLINQVYSDYEDSSKVIDEYIQLSTLHDDWGNDSLESREEHQFCCMQCCLNWISKNKKDLESNTRQFQIECCGKY